MFLPAKSQVQESLLQLRIELEAERRRSSEEAEELLGKVTYSGDGSRPILNHVWVIFGSVKYYYVQLFEMINYTIIHG